MQGHRNGEALTVTYIGLEYAKSFLQTLLFSGKPTEHQLEPLPFWRPNQLVESCAGDIVIVEATKHLIDKLPGQNAVVLPPYVHHLIDVRGDWEDVRSRFHKSIRKNELRWVRKYGYEYDVSHAPEDFEKFYYEMYLPTMNDRHEKLSDPMSLQESFDYFQYGHLFRVRRDGEWVSGMVCHFQEKILIADILGVKDADETLIHQGATAATYYAAIEWANKNGYEAVNFLGTGPYLNEGRFQHKRKWGMAVNIPPHLHRRIWIRFQRITPAVAQFLTENPIIITDKKNQLYGLIFVDDSHVSPEIKEELARHYMTPGLHALQIHSIREIFDFSNKVDEPNLQSLTPIHE